MPFARPPFPSWDIILDVKGLSKSPWLGFSIVKSSAIRRLELLAVMRPGPAVSSHQLRNYMQHWLIKLTMFLAGTWRKAEKQTKCIHIFLCYAALLMGKKLLLFYFNMTLEDPYTRQTTYTFKIQQAIYKSICFHREKAEKRTLDLKAKNTIQILALSYSCMPICPQREGLHSSAQWLGQCLPCFN